jgi:hypothetical protein
MATHVHGLPHDTVQKPPDKVFLIAHFSAWRSPRAMRIALLGSNRLAGSNGTKLLAPPCATNPRRDINKSRPGRAPERLNLVRSRKRSQTLIKEWKYVLGTEPGLAVGWCLGLNNSKGSSPARVEPTAARVLPKIVPNKNALASAAKATNEKKYVRSFLD